MDAIVSDLQIITQKVGASKFSEFTTFSFHPVKNITTIEGGAITTNSLKNYKKLVELKTFFFNQNKNK